MDISKVVVKENPIALQAKSDLAKEFHDIMVKDWQMQLVAYRSVTGPRPYCTYITLMLYVAKGMRGILEGEQVEICGTAAAGRMKKLFSADHPVWEFINNKPKYMKYLESYNNTTHRWDKTPNTKFVEYDKRPKNWMM